MLKQKAQSNHHQEVYTHSAMKKLLLWGLVVLVFTSVTLGLFIGLLNPVDIENELTNVTSLPPKCTGKGI